MMHPATHQKELLATDDWKLATVFSKQIVLTIPGARWYLKPSLLISEMRLRCPTGVKGKWVKFPRGPATVIGKPASSARAACRCPPLAQGKRGEGEMQGNDPLARKPALSPVSATLREKEN